MQVSTGGNVSMKLSDNLFLVKPSGLSLYDVQTKNLVLADARGRVVQGSAKPTKEIGTHLSIYRVRKEVGAVVHYHSPCATAYAVLAREIPLLTVHGKRILGRLPVIPEGEEGSEALGRFVEETFADPSIKAALLAGHGILAAGRHLTEAQNLAELVEESAKIAFLSDRLKDA